MLKIFLDIFLVAEAINSLSYIVHIICSYILWFLDSYHKIHDIYHRSSYTHINITDVNFIIT